MTRTYRWNKGGAQRGVKPGSTVKARGPNKRSSTAREVFDRYPGFCPVEQMILVAQDADTPLELRIVVCRELAQYLYPKLRAVEVKTDAATAAATGLGLVGLLRQYEGAAQGPVASGEYAEASAMGEPSMGPVMASTHRLRRPVVAPGQGSLFAEVDA